MNIVNDGVIQHENENKVETLGFEGPEKVLEIDFVDFEGRVPVAGGMRTLSREVWDKVLDLARCQILSKMSNDYFDAYVLSESSLFVYPHKVFIKTCGTTTLLRCLPLLLDEANLVGMQQEWIGYTRKNYTFPDVQEFPHSSFAQEIDYTRKCSGPNGEPLKGGAYVLGDLQSDHWYVYVADNVERANLNTERNMNIMMYDIDPTVAKLFFRDSSLSLDADAKRVTKETGICGLCPNAVIDDRMFEPCGYSMNALEGPAFYTIHVTPEEAFSYASFETNLESDDFTVLVEQVLDVFRPKRFAITLFADECALGSIKTCPTQWRSSRYTLANRSATMFRDEYGCRLSIFTTTTTAKNLESSSNGSTTSTSS